MENQLQREKPQWEYLYPIKEIYYTKTNFTCSSYPWFYKFYSIDKLMNIDVHQNLLSNLWPLHYLWGIEPIQLPIGLHLSRYSYISSILQNTSMTNDKCIPGIVFTMNKVCYFMHQPNNKNWVVVKSILCYLKHTMYHNLFISETLLQAFFGFRLGWVCGYSVLYMPSFWVIISIFGPPKNNTLLLSPLRKM